MTSPVPDQGYLGHAGYHFPWDIVDRERYAMFRA
jgi:hypothetical protein